MTDTPDTQPADGTAARVVADAGLTAPPQFALGRLVVSASVQQLLVEGVDLDHPTVLRVVARHVTGDWGDVCAEDAQSNVAALDTGARVFSSYQVAPDLTLWVITEADRSSTCVLLPSDY